MEITVLHSHKDTYRRHYFYFELRLS